MSITYHTGDLLLDDADALISPVNTIGISGSGLAKQFRDVYPDSEYMYVSHCRAGLCRIGQVLPITQPLGDPPHYIIYFPTKVHWRNPSKLKWIESGLVSLRQTVCKLYIHSIAIPKLGCGLGGLDWDDVKPLIEDFAQQVPDVDVRVYV